MWEGLFHAFTCTTAIGVVLLWRAGRRADAAWSGRLLVGGLAFGNGLFDVVDGVIDHEILGLHHVHGDVDRLAWDHAFLALMVLGTALLRRRAAERVAGPARLARRMAETRADPSPFSD